MIAFPESIVIMGHVYHNSRNIMGAILYYHLTLCKSLLIVSGKPIPADHIADAAWKEWYGEYYEFIE